LKPASLYSNGKLLITGEYLVLDGAKALAVPLSYGQSLDVELSESGHIEWRSFENKKLWFEAKYDLKSKNIIETNDQEVATTVQNIMNQIKRISGKSISKPLKLVSNIGFDRKFGWGTSSTLINNLADFFEIDPYQLLEKTFGGSGYDIACASVDKPIIYQIENNNRIVEPVNWEPLFKNNLYFAYLGKKQNSRDQIKAYKKRRVNFQDVEMVSQLTDLLIKTSDYNDFCKIVTEHEQILAGILNQKTVKEIYFYDFSGVVKSLGAWGGDFVMIGFEGRKGELKKYLQKKNISFVYSFNELVKQ
jgi:mevalonate kinase